MVYLIRVGVVEHIFVLYEVRLKGDIIMLIIS